MQNEATAKPKTYAATYKGRPVRVTVPDRPCQTCGGQGGLSPFTTDGFYCADTSCADCGGTGVAVSR